MRILMGKKVEEKRKWVYQEIYARVSQNPDTEHVVIVPEQYTVQAEKNLIHTIGCEGFINPEIISFNRLAYRVFQETGGRNRVVIDDLGKHMLVKKILVDLEAELMLFSGLAREPGMIDRIVESITEFKQYEISPDELLIHVKMIDDNQLLKKKLNDLIQVYKLFESSLAGNFVDREDQYLALMRQMKESDYIHRKVFWIDGFYSFTPHMLSVIKEMSVCAKEIHLTAYGSADWLKTDESILTSQVSQLIKDVNATGSNCQVVDVDAYLKNLGEPSIVHLSEKFAAIPIEPWNGKTEAIQLFSANNDDAEIEQVSSKILQLVQEKKYRFSEISVLCANLEERQDSLKRYFSLQKIPYFMDVRRKEIEHPLIRVVPLALDIIIKKYSNQSIMRYLKTGFSGLDQKEVEELENVALASGLRGSSWKKDISRSIDGNKLIRVNQMRKTVITPLTQLEHDLKKAFNVHQMTEAVYKWLTKTCVSTILEKEIEMLTAVDDLETASMLSQLWSKINALMDQLVDLLGDTDVPLVDYQNLWKTGLSSIEIGLIPPTNDQVMIGTPERSRQSGIKVLFLIGINDGVIPAIPGDTGALLLYEKELLQKSGCEIGTSGEMRTAQENLMIQLALGRPTERLWLSYSQATVEGEIRRPSTLIDRIKRVMPQMKTISDVKRTWIQEMELLWNPRYSYLSLASKLREKGDGKEISSNWSTLFKWYANQKEWRENACELKAALHYQNQPEKLDSNRASALFGKPFTGSVSRLEKFNRCPFAHYVYHGLKPSKRNVYEVSPPDVGTALHEIMDRFGKRVIEENINIHVTSAPEIQAITDDIASDVLENFNEHIFHSNARYRHYGIRIRRIGCRAINTTVYHLKKSGFSPFQHEISFGDLNKTDPNKAIVISDEMGESVYLEGRIDRVDRWQDETHAYYRVIDYKTGKNQFSVSEIMHGLQLQLVVYLMAALKSNPGASNKPVKPAGMYYFYLDDPLVELQSNNEEEASKKALEHLKLNGVTLNNVKVINEMDHEITNESDIIAVGYTKAGNFKKSSNVLSETDFSTLQQFTKRKIIESAKEILQGNIRIEPVQVKQWKACDYCQYQSICQFDQQFFNNQYKKIDLQSDEESLKSMTKALPKGGRNNVPMD